MKWEHTGLLSMQKHIHSEKIWVNSKKSATYLNVDILFLEYEGADFLWVHVEDSS